MKNAMHSIIFKNQNAFLLGRSINDNIIFAHELMKGYGRKNNSPGCFLKIDLQKAFDTIQWSIIAIILQKMNFPLPFVSWIYSCISTSYHSLSINGETFGYFKAT